MQTAADQHADAANSTSDSFEDAVDRMRDAAKAFINGDIGPWTQICSHADDTSLFGGWGAWERSWSELEPRYAWAAARFVSGEMAIEDIASNVSGDLGYTVWIERCQARLRGVDGLVPVALRVTHIYRNEQGTWRMIHRHADPLVAIQDTEAIVQSPE
ncbi:MAG TPA: nuclear transport factor 2 family protein [Ktedonobacterales bacterium]|nr:nuclear transport factor 2 family protein [Ktedonobacterales bacterium]